nr:unnamed protein product [Callosobruchus analis]
MERLDFALIQKPRVSNEGLVIALVICPGRNRTRSPSSSSAGAIVYCRRNNRQLVLRCDVNGYHRDWGISNISTRGEQLDNCIIDEGLMLNDISSEPTFVVINRQKFLT